MTHLFEYQNKETFNGSMDALETFLDSVWSKRERFAQPESEEDSLLEAQRFLQFIHKTKEIKSNKYIGVIQFEGERIQLHPKLFYQAGQQPSEDGQAQIQNHILWWLSYCRKIKFPNYQTSLGQSKSDFLELIIYLFSKYTRELLHSSVYRRYEEESDELTHVKGRINTDRYIARNLSRAHWHKIHCTFDSFNVDNQFNRIIKYVASLLFNVTQEQENKKFLREILFLLDEVSDERVTAEHCDRIHFNPMFSAFETVRDYCKLFLSSSVSFNYKNELKLFAFLLPMEYVFEDFIYGFIERELSEVKVKAQRSDTYLDEEHTFMLRPDLWIETPEKKFIADTKYKIIYSDTTDPKGGISQSDIYQMITYAMRFNVSEIKLLYPTTINTQSLGSKQIVVRDAIAGNHPIQITAHQIPIINQNLMNSPINRQARINELFEETRLELKHALEKCFGSSGIG